MVQYNDFIHTWYNCPTHFAICRGGGGSGKSVGIAQILLMKILQNPKFNVIAFRKYKVHARGSVFAEFKKQIEIMNIGYFFNINETNMTISVKKSVKKVGGNIIVCTGLDDPERIKSITTPNGNFTAAWCEEATELKHNSDATKDDIMQVQMRVRPEKYKPIIYLSFNPVDEHHWLYEFTQIQTKNERATEYFTTYKDNKFCPDSFKEVIESLMLTNENAYNIYALGQWGSLADSLVYPNWKFEHNACEKINAIDTFYGIDFGWVKSKTAIAKIVVGDDIFTPRIKEVGYFEGMTGADMIVFLKKQGITKERIYCDNANPDRIVELQRAGFNAHPTNDKSMKSVEFIQNTLRPIIDSNSKNIIKERSSYRYPKDKDGNFVQNLKGDAGDHLLDAIRYGLYSQYNLNKRYLNAMSMFLKMKRVAA